MRIALAALLTLAALALPAAASAQAPPPDEHAAAQAFADAAKRFEAAADLQDEDESDTPWLDACERDFNRVPARHLDEAMVLVIAHGMRLAFAELRGPLGAFRTELANVATADRILISGRAAVRQMGRRVDAVPAPGRFCRDLRAWRRARFPARPVKAAEADMQRALTTFTPGIMGKLHETALHLRELGVSKQDAEAFGGDAGW
jgi:hypothetical protein